MDDLKVFARSFRLMMALLIGAALLIAACVSENAGEWERVPLIPAIGAIALAVGFCVVLLTKGDPKRIAAGSGIAAGLALPTCFALPMVILFLSASDDRDDVAANRALMLLFVVAVYIVVQAFRQAQLGGQFAVGFAIAFLYALATAGAISVMPAHYQHRAAKEPLGSYEHLAPEALGTLRSVTGCLIKDQALHPDAGFPASLPTAAETHCDGYTVSSDVLKHYTLSYSPRNDANGTATDFRAESGSECHRSS
jgi:hypothetical protein